MKFNSKNILVLDDDSYVLRLVQTQLLRVDSAELAYEVMTFTDPLAALAQARKQRFDAVISDLRMPVMDGISFLKAIAAIQPHCARLILSGHSDTDSVLRMVDEAAIHRFVPKPWIREEFLTLLAEAIASVSGPKELSSHTLPRPTSTTLRTVPLLAELPDATLISLATVANWQAYGAGETIVRQNDQTKSVYFVISGFVKIMRGETSKPPVSAHGTAERRAGKRLQVMLAMLGPGDMMGEVATLLDAGRSASVVALTPCQVICMQSTDFLACVMENPPFALAVTRKMAQRLVASDRQLELMRGNLEGRIHAILRHCTAIGLDKERWLSNAEIARMAGATRVAVSQIMSRMSRAKETSAKK